MPSIDNIAANRNFEKALIGFGAIAFGMLIRRIINRVPLKQVGIS